MTLKEDCDDQSKTTSKLGAQSQRRRGNSRAALAIVFVLIVATSQRAQAQTFSVIYSFTGGSDGGNPAFGVTMDGTGNLYGPTDSGGAGYGTVYQLKHKGSSWTLNPLYSFTGGSDGA